MRTALALASVGLPPRSRVSRSYRPRRLSITCRNRILFREKEVNRGDGGDVFVTLSCNDPRSVHCRDVLKVSPGDTLRVGILNDSPATANVQTCPTEDDPHAELVLNWSPSEQTDDADTARRNLTANGGTKNARANQSTPGALDHYHSGSTSLQIDLLLAVPRPKVLRRLWAPLASLGLGNIFLTNATKVETGYFDASSIDSETVKHELVKGLEQSGDVHMPSVTLVKRFPAVLDAIGVTGEAPKKQSVERLVVADEDDENKSSPIEQPPIMLVAHPGSQVSLRQALRGAGKDSWGYGPRRVVIAIGPEPGWTPYELETLKNGGFAEVAVGNRTFSTDVACVALIAAVRERTETW